MTTAYDMGLLQFELDELNINFCDYQLVLWADEFQMPKLQQALFAGITFNPFGVDENVSIINPQVLPAAIHIQSASWRIGSEEQ